MRVKRAIEPFSFARETNAAARDDKRPSYAYRHTRRADGAGVPDSLALPIAAHCCPLLPIVWARVSHCVISSTPGALLAFRMEFA
jgi:hypothetical protein